MLVMSWLFTDSRGAICVMDRSQDQLLPVVRFSRMCHEFNIFWGFPGFIPPQKIPKVATSGWPGRIILPQKIPPRSGPLGSSRAIFSIPPQHIFSMHVVWCLHKHFRSVGCICGILRCLISILDLQPSCESWRHSTNGEISGSGSLF